MSRTNAAWLANLKPGDKVVRMLSGVVPLPLKITSIDEDFIHCGDWKFDRATGAEVDEELRSGPQFGITLSYLTPPQ